MRKINTLGLALAASLVTLPAMAATATGNLTVTATVQSSCLVGTSAGATNNAALNFGTISSTVAANDADTTTGTALSVLCNSGAAYTIWAGAGANASGTQRRMLGSVAGNYLPYNLYTTTGRTVAYPSSATDTTVGGTGTGAIQTYNVYGRIPAGTTMPAAGSYTDTVVMTVVY